MLKFGQNSAKSNWLQFKTLQSRPTYRQTIQLPRSIHFSSYFSLSQHAVPSEILQSFLRLDSSSSWNELLKDSLQFVKPPLLPVNLSTPLLLSVSVTLSPCGFPLTSKNCTNYPILNLDTLAPQSNISTIAPCCPLGLTSPGFWPCIKIDQKQSGSCQLDFRKHWWISLSPCCRLYVRLRHLGELHYITLNKVNFLQMQHTWPNIV